MRSDLEALGVTLTKEREGTFNLTIIDAVDIEQEAVVILGKEDLLELAVWCLQELAKECEN